MGRRRVVVLVCILMVAGSLAAAVALHEDTPPTISAKTTGTTTSGPPTSAPASALPAPSVSPVADTLTFAAVGDIGSGNQGQDTLEGMAKAKPDMHIALGDLSYAGKGSETRWCEL